MIGIQSEQKSAGRERGGGTRPREESWNDGSSREGTAFPKETLEEPGQWRENGGWRLRAWAGTHSSLSSSQPSRLCASGPSTPVFLFLLFFLVFFFPRFLGSCPP